MLKLKPLKKQAQIRMAETIAILFIFFILVALGISFYAKYREVSFEESKEEMVQARAIRTTLKALFLPEVICSRGDAEPEENCVDMLKARHFQEALHDEFNETYFELFSFSKISIQELYPNNQELVLYDSPKLDIKKKENTFFIVALRDETLGERGVPQYGFGYLKVEVYS